uniref:ATP synthase F0 subunit 6 n=1 Tax=Trichuris discolor TaxID=483153 RepID=J3S805_9BILA|nr:ATP synthase F0 subunit 6 [Trichuris discolor]AFK81041.1 ATP synthase F0 subunit 6 [Trichuris discolor]
MLNELLFLLMWFFLTAVSFYYIILYLNSVDLPIEMMYGHMAMTPMDWSTLSAIGSTMSIMSYILVYFFMPKTTNFNSRWLMLLSKFSQVNLPLMCKSYLVVMSISLFVLVNNIYSVFSYNWIPNTQAWVMLSITTTYLLSLWIYMILNAGLKLFGTKIPLSWYLINLSLWLFHNLSFFIRFISLPFRMMMNLIVGCFLAEFVKTLSMLTAFISLYELFVITVQSLVFIILCNMYYSEMIILPEWKHDPTHKPIFLPVKSFLGYIKYTLIQLLMKY